MIDEAMQGLDSLAAHDIRGFRHAMAMSCHDALVGRSAIERALHPCALLARPPPATNIAALRAQLERRSAPACMHDESHPITGKSGGWDCAPYGVEGTPVFP
ncbi:MAG TPA: hypothetical protein VGH28_29975 [Polyangiaceae bacterium]